MATCSDKILAANFPLITDQNYRKTSEATTTYNCIAWAAEDSSRSWWPIVDGYWPIDKTPGPTLKNFYDAFETLGYTVCSDALQEEGFQKIAFYMSANFVTHAARQLSDGTWTSKLGGYIDINHHTLNALESSSAIESGYGRLAGYMKKATNS